jgi:hypothetical protein
LNTLNASLLELLDVMAAAVSSNDPLGRATFAFQAADLIPRLEAQIADLYAEFNALVP